MPPTAESPGLTVAVVLAGGEGRRFGGPTHKLAAPLRGRPLLRHAVDTAVAAAIGPVVVVTGAVALCDVTGFGATASTAGTCGAVTEIVNHRWVDGQATSLQAAVAEAGRLGADAIVVGLGDQPFLEPDAWRLVAATRDTPIAVATYDGRRGHPVRLARPVWTELDPIGDNGAKRLMAVHPHLVTEVPCPGSPVDIDTSQELARWQSDS